MAGLVIDLTPTPVEEAGVRIEQGEDGSVMVDLAPDEARPQQARPGEDNLAASLDQTTLDRIAADVVEYARVDEESRRDWYDRFTEGLKKCGALPAVAKPSFAGETTAIHPLIMEAVTQFQARAVEELFPSSGPVKAQILGEVDEEVEAQRDRVEAHMNYQIQVEDPEYFWDTDQMLFVLGFAGSTFKKSYYDDETGCVMSRFLMAEDVLIPYSFRGHITRSPRITHQFKLSHVDFTRRVESGSYVDARVGEPTSSDDTETLAVQADGTSPSSLDEDREHTMLECHCEYKVGEKYEPYIITVEKEAVRVVSIRSNKIKNGQKAGKRRCWFTHYKLLPGLGAYGYGFIHAIGGLGEAATEAMQELLHSAKFASRQGGFKSRDARVTSKQTTLEPGVYKDTEMTAEELRNAFFNPPFKEPAPALFSVLGLLVEAGQRFGSITEAMVGQGGDNTPVGTTIARIEQGSKVYSGIHKRLHRAAGEEFRLRAELNRDYLEATGRVYAVPGSRLEIHPEDYDERIDIIPVSDPNIVSTPQRIALAQAVVQRAQQMPGLYDLYEAERRFLRDMKVPDIDKVLPKRSDLVSMDAVSEGQAVLTGKPFKAFPEQDHGAHIMVHQGQLMMVKGSPMEAQVTPVLMAHIAEHMAHQYRLQMSQQIGIPLPPLGEKPQDQIELPPEMEHQISTAAAVAVQQQMAAIAQQQMAASQPPQPPMDPRAEEMADLDLEERRVKIDKARAELTGQETANAAQTMAEAQTQALAGLVQQVADSQAMLQQAITGMGQSNAGIAEMVLSLSEILQKSMEQSAATASLASQRGEQQTAAVATAVQSMSGMVESMQRAVEQNGAAIQGALDQAGSDHKATADRLAEALKKQQSALDQLAKSQAERAQRPIVVQKQGDSYVVQRETLQ